MSTKSIFLIGLLIVSIIGVISFGKIDFVLAANTSITFGTAIMDRINFTGDARTYSFSANVGD